MQKGVLRMKVNIVNKRVRCAGKLGCENIIFCNIKFNKYSVNLCKECMTDLYMQLGKIIIPKSVKSKFYLENNEK